MIVAHGPAFEALLVEHGEDVHAVSRIRPEVVPFVETRHPRGKMARRWMGAIEDEDLRLLGRRMVIEEGADEPAVPCPAVFGGGGAVDAGESAAVLNVRFERRLLLGVEHVLRRVQKDDRRIAGKVLYREGSGLFGGIDDEAVFVSKALNGVDAGGDGLMTISVRLREYENADIRCGLRRNGAAICGGERSKN